MAPPLKHASSQLGSVIFRLPGPFTVDTAPRILESLQELYHPNLRFILLDFTKVHEVDSSALATLLWGFHYTNQHRVRVGIVGVSAKLRALVELYHLETVFRLSPN